MVSLTDIINFTYTDSLKEGDVIQIDDNLVLVSNMTGSGQDSGHWINFWTKNVGWNSSSHPFCSVTGCNSTGGHGGHVIVELNDDLDREIRGIIPLCPNHNNPSKQGHFEIEIGSTLVCHLFEPNVRRKSTHGMVLRPRKQH